MRLYCPPAGVCLDPHIGSGTTAAACEELGIQWIGIEQDEDTVKEANDFIKHYKEKNPKPTVNPQQKLFE